MSRRYRNNYRDDPYGKEDALRKRSSGAWNYQSTLCGYVYNILNISRLNESCAMLACSVIPKERLLPLLQEGAKLVERELESDDALREELEETLLNSDKPSLPAKPDATALFAVIDSSEHRDKLISILQTELIMLADEYNQLNGSSSFQELVKLAAAFELDIEDRNILQCLYLIELVEELNDVVSEWTIRDFFTGISTAIGLSEYEVQTRLSPRAKLIKYELVDERWGRNNTFGVSNQTFAFLSITARENPQDMFLDSVPLDETYPLESFGVAPESTNAILEFLSRTGSNNILLFGKEGTGKTEYAKSLCKARGKKLVRFSDPSVKSRNDSSVLNLILAIQSIPTQEYILLVDEAEEILSTKANSFFSFLGARESSKSRVNELLDFAKCPIIWIVNSTAGIDDSTLRRFCFAEEFRSLTPAIIRGFTQQYLVSLPLSQAAREKIIALAGRLRLNASSVRYIRDSLKAMLQEAGNPETLPDDAVLSRVRAVFESNVRLLTGEVPNACTTVDEYDLDILNTSVDARTIVDAVRRAGERRIPARFLFTGASGTGKTEFARYIAETVGRTLTVKQASDILSPWVGMSEHNIASIFRDAERDGSVLFIDEADSFFFDRAGAARSWERTLVNEFLTRIENFSGVLICATNVPESFDAAFARRFHQTVQFEALDIDAIPRILRRYFPTVSFTDEDLFDLYTCGKVTPGDVGALAGRIALFSDPSAITAQYVVRELGK